MSEFKHISVQEVADDTSAYTVVDIRDPQSFALGHMPKAVHLSNDNFATFLQTTPKHQPVVVVCYHGISSQRAAQVIVSQGFDTVFSMDGGFEAWKLAQPVVTD
ncbi:thiosulfate sulfurtransferase GlpE [Salinimonas sediminis]|uniref:Thiosulfate sulfurtransferase GlpE n=1 Tax=Salinimonas sediminis TaxID=2303538 RepID=A0A346NRW4_9ALTE|nr:thiosulfate sulfurtransferase GlpE [Salinimonas sediminis]AXR08271.1 thiosulfate sulfurtransferase GlpE [Salinimonas sediminis]